MKTRKPLPKLTETLNRLLNQREIVLKTLRRNEDNIKLIRDVIKRKQKQAATAMPLVRKMTEELKQDGVQFVEVSEKEFLKVAHADAVPEEMPEIPADFDRRKQQEKVMDDVIAEANERWSKVPPGVFNAPSGSQSAAIQREADKRWRNWSPGVNAKGKAELSRPRITTFIKQVREERLAEEKKRMPLTGKAALAAIRSKR